MDIKYLLEDVRISRKIERVCKTVARIGRHVEMVYNAVSVISIPIMVYQTVTRINRTVERVYKAFIMINRTI